MDWGDYYVYDETSPSCLRHKHDVFTGRGYKLLRFRCGDVAGTLVNCGYYSVSRGGKQKLAHRIVWEMHNGEIPIGYVIDHINGVATDNRLSNLRLTTQKENMRNQKMFSTNTSGVTGVSFDDSDGYERWIANWYENGKLKKRSFSVAKYGQEALAAACAARARAIESLGGYTDRHGQ